MLRKKLVNAALVIACLYGGQLAAQSTELVVTNNSSSTIYVMVYTHDENCDTDGATQFIEVSAALSESLPELSLAQKLYACTDPGNEDDGAMVENVFTCDQNDGAGEFLDSEGNPIYIEWISESEVLLSD